MLLPDKCDFCLLILMMNDCRNLLSSLALEHYKHVSVSLSKWSDLEPVSKADKYIRSSTCNNIGHESHKAVTLLSLTGLSVYKSVFECVKFIKMHGVP